MIAVILPEQGIQNLESFFIVDICRYTLDFICQL